MIRGVRGATTVNMNDETLIVRETEKLYLAMISENELKADNVASVLISVTDDIDAAFPAKAQRNIEGWKYVPVMCMKEIAVPESLQLCIRIMMHVNTDKGQQEIHHVYLNNAVSLRPDLSVSK
ncbi:chorismate mutase [Peribacillus saganii]|uniref:chorismate mutase n=1 Tax=Peribacillus saganii TaxID=2303992 RepID=A0A372LMG7_9BACI|nr:chorismate mutase [Peribacillus saganii]RFU68493.1 chorismate mutase [Peribacillus saganii]